jgi:hypothetical protein
MPDRGKIKQGKNIRGISETYILLEICISLHGHCLETLEIEPQPVICGLIEERRSQHQAYESAFLEKIVLHDERSEP